jgi:hypothetical protein
MGGMTTGTTVRAITATAVALTGLLALVGCSAGSTHPAPSSSARPSGGAAAGASATSGPSASAAPVGTRVDVPCDTLVPTSVFDAYGKPFALVAGATPTKGSPAADIAAQRGRVCVWRDGAGDTTVTLGVASLPAAPLTKLKDSLYEDSNSVPTYTVEGYFDMDGDVGRADAFVDPYWVDVESTLFTEPGTAQPMMDAVRAALVAAGGSGASGTGVSGSGASGAPSASATP